MNWIQRRIEEAGDTEASVLDLSVFSSARKLEPPDILKDLPAGIFELTNLERLDLRGHDIREIPPQIALLSKLRDLTVSSQSSLEISRAIAQLPLRQLWLSSHSDIAVDLRAVPDLESLRLGTLGHVSLTGVEDMRDLSQLGLSFRMSEIPPEMKHLTSIRDLSLARPGHERLLLEGLASAEVLETLRLTGRWDLSQWQSPRLRQLELASVTRDSMVVVPERLFELPLRGFSLIGNADRGSYESRLAKLHDLEKLDLNGVKIPGGMLAACRHLKSLHLVGGAFELSDLLVVLDRGELTSLELMFTAEGDYEAIFKCRKLAHLNLRGAPAAAIKGSLSQLTLLEVLQVSGCSPSTFRDLHVLKCLRHLSLAMSEGHGWPEWLCEMPDLKGLQLYNLGLTTIPADIAALRNLETLDVSLNQIREVPRELANLPKLKMLGLWRNPIASPPPEIAARGLASIQEYFDALDEGPVEILFESKLLLVGEGAVGKTLLGKRLMAPEGELSSEAADVTSTRGIEIREWPLRTDQGKPFRVHLWDFGGQEIYHATHQFFLTRRSLYLFVWEARREDRVAGFDYWLNVVTLLSGGSPILVILNKADERVREIDQRTLQEKFPNIRGFYTVSALTGRGITDLIRDIQTHATALPHVGERWASSWSQVRKRLETDGRNYIDRDEYHRLAAAEGVHGEEAGVLSTYLHDLGVILHFQDDPLLHNLVVLKPTWATNAVYAVLDTRDVQEHFGRFSLRDLPSIWSRTSYPPARYAELLQLMARFELCFRLGDTQEYVAPELLRAAAPDYPWEPNGELRLEYRYSFMPAGILTQFIARNHALIEGDLYWRNGTVLTWEGARALVVAEPLDRRIRVAVTGQEKQALLSVIRRELAHIHRTLNHPEVEEMVPCTCPVCVAGDAHFHKFRDLLGYRQHAISRVLCPRGFREVSIGSLLEGFPTEIPASEATGIEQRAAIAGDDNVQIQIAVDNASVTVARRPPPSKLG